MFLSQKLSWPLADHRREKSFQDFFLPLHLFFPRRAWAILAWKRRFLCFPFSGVKKRGRYHPQCFCILQAKKLFARSSVQSRHYAKTSSFSQRKQKRKKRSGFYLSPQPKSLSFSLQCWQIFHSLRPRSFHGKEWEEGDRCQEVCKVETQEMK